MVNQISAKGLKLVVFLCAALFTGSAISESTNVKPSSDKPENKAGKIEKVVLETDLGNITLALYPEKAPITVANFLEYVDNHYYDGTVFHRIVPGFVVQGGGYRFDYSKKETLAPIVNESNNGLRNARGSISMARTPNPDSATSQFYINLNNNFNLDAAPGKPGYAVFGQVIDGFSVVKQIEVQPQGKNRFFRNAPNEPIQIVKAYRLTEQDSEKAPAAAANKSAAAEKLTKKETH